MAAAANAVSPIATPPQPGTAVKEPARSIVSRIKRRLSAARSSRGTRTGRGERAGSAGAMDYENTHSPEVVKFFAPQSWKRRSLAPRFPAILPDKWHEAAMVKRALSECAGVLLQIQQLLLVRGSHRHNQM